MFSKITFLIKFVLIVLKTEQVSTNLVGVYTDNGFDQTVAYQVADELEKDEIEYQILDILGLSSRPKQNWAEESINQSAPHFLLKIYEKLHAEDENIKTNRRVKRYAEGENKLVTPLDEKELSESDNIMTFMSSSMPLFKAPIFQSQKENILWFNTTDMPNNTLIAAQIKLYKHRSKIPNTKFEIAVYKIQIRSKTEIGLSLVSTKKTTSDYEGWLELNVSAALSEWILNPKDNKGLYISTSMLFAKGIKKDVGILDIGLISITTDSQFKPFMVGYFKSSEEIPRFKRTTTGRRKTKSVNPFTIPEQFKTPRSCQKLSFSVDFKKLNWQNFIIAPDTFESYLCSGDCSFPLNANMNTTNHAIIQTLARLQNPNLPKPCCVPVALSSMSVVYHFSEDRINMKKYDNMVIKNCGCL